MKYPEKKIETLLRKNGIVRTRDLVAAGASRMGLARRVATGELQRVARGLYSLPGPSGGEHQALALVARRAPDTIFCLLTALRFHGLTTQNPAEVWIAIGNKDRPPRLDYPPLRAVRFSESSRQPGLEIHRVQKTPIRITGIAKTLADCFKFRNKIGLDVALEALRDARRANRVDADDLWRAAKIDRVSNIMRPYLEAMP